LDKQNMMRKERGEAILLLGVENTEEEKEVR
jgi:hypothetical protein